MKEQTFIYIKLKGKKLNPENFDGKEPRYEEIYNLYSRGCIKVEREEYVAVEIKSKILQKGGREKEFREVIWISKQTYEYAKEILGSEKVYYVAHEGVSFDVARGAWKVVGEPKPVSCPPGYGKECVYIKTKLSEKLGIGPFIVEQKFVFKGISGEHIVKGKIIGHVYLVLAYDREKRRFLTKEELAKTLLYKNYLSKPEVKKVLESVSKHMRREWWHVERMRAEVLAKYKVVWRDVAKEFIPAVDIDGVIPDHNVHYVIADSLDEAYYLMTILLSPQVNAVVRELSPWIGHIQPRFIRYFKIPKYNSCNPVHKRLAEIGRSIHQDRVKLEDVIGEIEQLVKQLSRKSGM